MQLFDTHCHIHEIVRSVTPVHDKWVKGGVTDADALWREAQVGGVQHAICVGTTVDDSVTAVDFVQNYADLYASIGIHPHEAKDYSHELAHRGVANSSTPSSYDSYDSVRASFAPSAALSRDSSPQLVAFCELAVKNKVVAVGECGLDYFYTHSPKKDQIELLKFQLTVAKEHNLPVIFHVREAFDDFWPIFDQFTGLTGVIHSFTADSGVLAQALSRGLYIGLNGIMTFTKDENQLDAAKAVPLGKLLLETDAPFLTPKPYRGTINRLQYVAETAEFLAKLRGETLHELANASTANAHKLFKTK